MVEAPRVQIIGDALISETKLEKAPIVSVLETHISSLLSKIKLKKFPVVSVFETPIVQVVDDALTSGIEWRSSFHSHLSLGHIMCN